MTAGPNTDPREFMHEQLAQASPDLLRELMEGFINALVSADADSVCGAACGVREADRVNRPNGHRHRDLDPRGTLDVAVPSRGRGPTSRTGCSSAAAGRGGADRRGGDLLPAGRVHPGGWTPLVQSLGITGLARTGVSVMARDLDALVADSRQRPLNAGPYTCAAADALTVKVREGGRVVKIAAMVATGVNQHGYCAAGGGARSRRGSRRGLCPTSGAPSVAVLPVVPMPGHASPPGRTGSRGGGRHRHSRYPTDAARLIDGSLRLNA